MGRFGEGFVGMAYRNDGLYMSVSGPSDSSSIQGHHLPYPLSPREFGRIFKHGRLGYVCEGRRNPDVTGVPGQIRLMEKTHGDDIGSH